MYKLVKLGQIVVGAAVPVAALAAPAVLTAIIAASIVVAEGAQQLYQWQSNWLRYRLTAEALKREKHLYLTHSGPYRSGNRRTLLAERVEAIVAAENTDWAAEFEQPEE